MKILNKLKLQHYRVILFSLILSVELSGQQISRHVIGAGGNSFISSNLHLSYTIGQAGLAGSFTNGSYGLNAGFQQADQPIQTGIYDFDHAITLAIYPNPFAEYFVIQIESEFPGKLVFSIYDINGKIVFQRRNANFSFHHYHDMIETSGMITGTYILEVTIFPATGNSIQYSIPISCHK